jgi:hypothetical protein
MSIVTVSPVVAGLVQTIAHSFMMFLSRKRSTGVVRIPKEIADCNTRLILSLLVKIALVKLCQANSLNAYRCAMMDKYFWDDSAFA